MNGRDSEPSMMNAVEPHDIQSWEDVRTEGRLYIRRELLPALATIGTITVFNPWEIALKMTDAELIKCPMTLSKNMGLKIGDANFKLIDQSHAILANLIS